jgi:hypothetical protein
LINLLFAGLFDLIIGRMTQMGLLIPNAGEGSTLRQIFQHQLPKIKEGEKDKYLIGAEIITFVKWLIYTAPFKDANLEPRGTAHAKFVSDWRHTIRSSEEAYRTKLKDMLTIWYTKHPPSRKRAFAHVISGDDDEEIPAGVKCRRRTVNYVPPPPPLMVRVPRRSHLQVSLVVINLNEYYHTCLRFHRLGVRLYMLLM